MKHLPKHLRPRYRYLAVELSAWPDAAVSRRAFQRAAREAAGSLLGDVGRAAVDADVLSFRFADGTGEAVVRTRRGQVEELRAALAAVSAVEGQSLGIRVRGVSGTVRACEEKYIHGPEEPSEERTVAFADADRTAVVRNDRVDVRCPEGFVGATARDIREN